MEVTMEGTGGELESSGCSYTSTTEDDDGVCTWNDWSPLVDWGPFSVETMGDFHGLIESMMCNDNSMDTEEGYDGNGPSGGSMVYEPLSSSTTTTSASSPTGNSEELKFCVGLGAKAAEDNKGLRLVHLLMAAAEALTGANKSRDLARVILVRLKEMVSPAAAGGTNMERLAVHFTDALQGLLDTSYVGGGTRSATAAAAAAAAGNYRADDQQYQHSDVLAAFQLLQDMSPYVKFGHFTSNQAILEAVGSDRRIHIVDYDIMEGVQWASLMQALVSRKDGPPPSHLRITAVTRAGGSGGMGRKSMGSVQETGRRLVAFAASVGQPFSFGQCRLDQGEKFCPLAIKAIKGEALVANCVLHPPHRAPASVASFLTGMGSLSAKLITLVEEEEEIRKGGDESGFVGRFMDELYRYSAVWDSLEAGFPMQGRARGLVERVILGPRIARAVGRAYRQKEENDGKGGWGDWMSSMGFNRTGMSFFNHCQARLLLGLFNDGYRAEEDEPNKLVLCWKSRRLISASVWSAPPLPSPSTSTVMYGFTTNKQESELQCY